MGLKDMTKPSQPFGSFREKDAMLPDLPASISALRSTDIDWKRYALQKDASHLNHGAFGAVPIDFLELESALRSLVESNPSHFYDKMCIPLLRETLQEASSFFGGTVLLHPNCTVALKSVLSLLYKEQPGAVVGVLEPIYGATRKLVSTMAQSPVVISPGLFNEDAASIIAALDAAYSSSPFHILVADRVTSQSGRLLPLAEVVEWCRAKGVVSVVDGTQDFSFNNPVWSDYYVMSTHKWLCNVKTCAIIRLGEGVKQPGPVGISFGYPDAVDAHLWTGMHDYIPYIMLAKVLRVYRVHGERMVEYSSNLLQKGLNILRTYDGGNAVGLAETLPVADETRRSAPRVMAMLEVFRILENENLQDVLETYGLYVSVKDLGGKKYLRISAWTYNTEADFLLLRDFIHFRLKLNYREELPLTVLSMEDRSNRKRNQILSQLKASFEIEERLFGTLQDAGFFIRAEPLRHPLIFYYGHVAVFYMNKLIMGGFFSCEDRIDSELETLCAVGVDEMAWDDLWLGSWDKIAPEEYSAKLQKVKQYRRKIQEIVTSIILNQDVPLTLPVDPTSVWWILLMGMEHSRIHVETSSAILTQMPLAYFSEAPPFSLAGFEPDRARVRQNTLVPVRGGSVCPGRSMLTTEYYGWDNEFGKAQETVLTDFEVSSMMVSNAEYAEFVEGGGYDNSTWWSEKGWQWAADRTQPMLWQADSDGKTKYRSLSQMIDMPYDWPAAVTNFEAEAFCNWKSAQLGKKVRMISYSEWLLLAKRSSDYCAADYNTNFCHHASPCAVTEFGSPVGKDGALVYDICGNMWQHSRSSLSVLPEFTVHPVYDDFTLPTIDGEHSFILGGSFLSMGNMSSLDARYGFRRHFFQFAGIRYVVSDNEECEDIPTKVFEGDVAMQLMENYTDFTDKVRLSMQPVANGLAEFGAFAAQHVRDGDSVIVLNGSVGRVTTEVASKSNPGSIVHTDGTANALDAFLQLKDRGAIRYARRIEGMISKTETITLSSEFKAALRGTDVSVKQIDVFRFTEGVVNPQDVAVLDLTMLSAMNCPRRGDGPPNLHIAVKPGGKLVVLRPIVENRHAKDEATFPGFVRLDTAGAEAQKIVHICRETRRKHRFAVSECMVFERTAESVAVITSSEGRDACTTPQYEQAGVLEAYERFHFKFTDIYGIKNFPQQCAEVCIDACIKHNVSLTMALDCGCGPGRLGVDLASRFKQVIAYDLATGFVDMAKKHAPDNMAATLGDAMAFQRDPLVQGRKFNLIVGSNLVDRVPDPRQWIKQSTAMLADDGLLVVFTPFTWLREYSDQEKWFGGFRRDAEVVWSLNGAVACAGPELCLKQPPTHVPFVIPDADGSFQYTYSQCMVFGRKSANPTTMANFLPDIALNYCSPA